ncbi:MAG: hypothetical protein Q9174_006344, partial [Haloplaca sp. 1 TL-2023]
MASLIRTLRKPAASFPTYPPVFLAPALLNSTHFSATFSTSPPLAQRKKIKRRDGNKNRGVSALRRKATRYPLEMKKHDLPQPVLDSAKRSKVAVDEKHGLWDFFRPNKKALPTPEGTAKYGALGTIQPLRLSSTNLCQAVHGWWRSSGTSHGKIYTPS